MPGTTDDDLLSLNNPGTVIEIDPRTAEDLGAFEEQALTEADALASTDIPPEYLPDDESDAQPNPEGEDV